MEDKSHEQHKPDRLSDITGIISEFNSPESVKEEPGLTASPSKPENEKDVLTGQPATPGNAAQKPPNEPIKPEDANLLPDNDAQLPKDVGLPPKDVGRLPKDVGLLPEDVGLRPENAGHLPDNVGFNPKDVGLRSKDAGLLPEDAGLRPEDVGMLPKDVGLLSKSGKLKSEKENPPQIKALKESENKLSHGQIQNRQIQNQEIQSMEENLEQENPPADGKSSLLQSLLNPSEQEGVEVIQFNRNLSFLCDKSGSVIKPIFSHFSNYYNRKEKRWASVMLKQIKFSCRILNGYTLLSTKEYLLIHREITRLLSGQRRRVTSVFEFTNVLIYACTVQSFNYEDLGKAFLYQRRTLERIIRVLKVNGLVKLHNTIIDKYFFITSEGREFVRKALESE